MASLNDSFYIARSGVITQQERLAVISHNIANVDTKGYHRQKAVLGTNPPNNPNLFTTRGYSIGTGVKIQDIIRLRDEMREKVLMDESGDLAMHQQLADSLGDIEALLNGLGETSLTNRLQEFWSSWQDLANNADRMAYRSTLLERSVSLTDQLNQMSQRLSDYRDGIAAGGVGPAFTGAAATEVDSVNNLAARIQDLNRRIFSMSNSGYNPNDLEDQRDLLLRDLGEKLNISVGADSTIAVDGQTLISGDGTVRNELSITDTATMQFMLNGAAVTLNKGSLGGMIETVSTIDAMSANLDTLASELIAAVNAVHLSGYDLEGNPGIEFFTGTGADDIAVNPLLHDPTNSLLDNPQLIAAANTIDDPGPPVTPNVRDGANALEIADLSQVKIAGLNNQTFGDYFSSMMADLGAQIQDEQDLVFDGEAVVSMLESAVQSQTGVNLDEELMEMISAQRAYQAAARLVTTIDELMEVVINRMGV
ncbi:MAG TPA: flagellar hook-associated protein FlgK [Verrucomicrobia bacterium]|nr:MAG: flagellar hook-associated protein FlgK [Lentisphaerae bacterium GWF2_57_35]HBA84122.1 flagellar hook-associated protein FlgK [Verrucomicrobiota bacterium]